MRKLGSSLARAGIAVALVITASSAYALNDHSWVSSTGGGTACTRTSPCSSVANALSNTNAGGVISMLDQGAGDGAGTTITKAITIRAVGVDAGTTFSPSTGEPFLSTRERTTR